MLEKCKECKWFKDGGTTSGIVNEKLVTYPCQGECHLEPKVIMKLPADFCSHWSSMNLNVSTVENTT